jgi:hypothetical protein
MTPRPLDLDAVEALCAAATPGPWTVEEDSEVWELYAGRDRRHHGLKLAKCMKRDQPYAEYWPQPGDAAFIAAARTLVPQLVARCRELESELAAAKSFIPTLTFTAADITPRPCVHPYGFIDGTAGRVCPICAARGTP